MDLSYYRKKLKDEGTDVSFSFPDHVAIMKELEEHDERRHIFIVGEITSPVFCGDDDNQCQGADLMSVLHTIQRYNHEDGEYGIAPENRTPIKIFINSSGGDVFSTMSLVGAIKASKTPVWTINIGSAFSAAGIILTAGHKRFALPNSYALIHSGSVGIQGTQEQVASFNTLNKNINDRVKEHILNSTKISAATYNKKIKTDWYLDDNDQLSFGLVDEIATDVGSLY